MDGDGRLGQHHAAAVDHGAEGVDRRAAVLIGQPPALGFAVKGDALTAPDRSGLGVEQGAGEGGGKGGRVKAAEETLEGGLMDSVSQQNPTIGALTRACPRTQNP